MKKIDFNKDWKFCRLGEEETFVSVDLPHDAMISEPRTELSAGGTNTGWYEANDYVYLKTFDVPVDCSNKKVIFEFEGVYRNTEVYINGIKAYYRPHGYIGFYVDADEYLKYGLENEIKVIAKNADQPNSRWYSGAGIYRPVWMHIADKEKYILPEGIRVRTISINPVFIEVSVATSCQGVVNIEIYDDKNFVSKTSYDTNNPKTAKIAIPYGKLWSIESPNLYICRVKFEEDEAETTFGIRIISMSAERGFCLNGKRIVLLGACMHHDNGMLGSAAYSFAEYRKVKFIKASGYNSIRSAHNPTSKAVLEACDRLGVLVMDELCDMWYIHKTKYDYAAHFDDWWKTDLDALISRDYNHPSVIMYSTGNEVSETAQPRGIELSGEMTAFCKERDPDRFVTCGINLFFNYLSSMGMGVYSDKKAEAVVGPKKKKKKAVGSEFFNNLAGLLGAGFMKFGATLPGSDKKTRDAFAKFDAAGYNYGINRYKKDIKKYPNRIIIGSETFPFDAYKFYEFAKKHPSVVGDFVWVGMDYLGEVGIGSWEYRNYAPDFSHGAGWVTAGCGRMDITGKPNGEMAYTRVAYELDKIRMAVVPVDGVGNHSPASWRMTNAIESWSWGGCEGKYAKVEVYARAAYVKIIINDKPIATKNIKKDCRTVFKVPYKKGEIIAIGYDKSNHEIGRTSLKSAEGNTRLVLLPETNESGIDGLCYVRMCLVGENDVTSSTARSDIKISVTGGKLLAAGNGCSYNERGYLTNVTDTYYGEAMVIIKPESDEVKVFAESSYGNAETKIKVI